MKNRTVKTLLIIAAVILAVDLGLVALLYQSNFNI